MDTKLTEMSVPYTGGPQCAGGCQGAPALTCFFFCLSIFSAVLSSTDSAYSELSGLDNWISEMLTGASEALEEAPGLLTGECCKCPCCTEVPRLPQRSILR
eukprot:1161698-Pelagomonas_calceolata.AAC.10